MSDLDKLKEQELRKATAEALAAEADALKATRDAWALDLKAEVPAETLDAGDKASPIAEVVAYAELGPAAAAIAAEIASDVDSLEGARVLLVRSADLSRDHGAYVLLRNTSARMTAAVAAETRRLAPPEGGHELRLASRGVVMGDEVAGEAVAAGVGAAGAVAAGLAGGPLTMGISAIASLAPALLSLARSNVTIRSRDVTIKDSAMLGALCNQLLNQGASVTLAGFAPVAESEIFAEVLELQAARDALADLRATWQLKADLMSTDLAVHKERLSNLEDRREALLTATPPAPAEDVDRMIEERRREIAATEAALVAATGKVASSQRVIDSVDAFVTAIETVPSGGSAPLVAAAAWEQFLSAGEKAFILYVEAAFGGGESQYEEKAFADKAQHLGGVAVSFLMTDRTGLIRSGGIVTRLGTTTHKVGETNFDYDSAPIRGGRQE